MLRILEFGRGHSYRASRFGFSVRDFVAAIELTIRIVKLSARQAEQLESALCCCKSFGLYAQQRIIPVK